MSKPYYADYIKHCLRFYVRCSKKPNFKNNADMENWTACHFVLKKYSEKEKAIINDIYSSYDTISDAVFEAAKKYNIDQNVIWDMMKVLERKVAKKRGLL